MKSNEKFAVLFKELARFSIPTYKEWRSVTEKILKSSSFNSLFTSTYEDIILQPIYEKADDFHSSYPSDFPYRRGTNAVKKSNKAWEISQELLGAVPTKVNKKLLHALKHGQTAVHLVLDDASKRGFDPDEVPPEWVGRKGVSIATIDDMKEIFQGVDLSKTPLFIHTGALSLPLFVLLQSYLKNHSLSSAALQGTIGMNPLGMLSVDGILQSPLNVYYDSMANIITWSKQNSPSLRTVLVEGHPFHNGGASAVEELAFSIACGVEYLRALLERNVSIEDAASSFSFSFSIGSNFFMEIAKFRAARVLWASIVEAFGGSNNHSKIWIHARTSEWNKTIYDPYVNMIRSTVEAFAAAASDIDSLHISSFNEPIQSSTSFAERIARNTHFILQEEANFNKIIDPGGGSFYIESLTDSLAEAAWVLFQKVEEKGGLYKALQQGFPQEKINKTAKKREQNIHYQKDVFVGTNKYVNIQEKKWGKNEENRSVYEERIKSFKKQRKNRSEKKIDIQIDLLIDQAKQGLTLGMIRHAVYKETPSISIRPILKQRAAASFEKLRFASERYSLKNNKKPTVFLVNIGELSSFRKHVDFASDLLKVGGFKVLRSNEFQTVKEAVKAIISLSPNAVVLCSKEERHPTLVPALMKELNKVKCHASVLLAGQPSNQQRREYEQLGVFAFLNENCNSYDVLLKLQKERGMHS
ncbi:methylmalonyl-CoA mutase family protein [Bacillus taeanensis]|uniref:methylmalonyl-CoA mutase n=1 Tax=Bacillus taeanensis TaxID=273032 RepID=A0A366XYA6_9BACI|nr:methylmalonyl-CoA mutase family protein [Bacillus taeanensis]RBW70877.1 methylmalonyl-CoA mutase [Bacillus taeanensis]